MLDLETLYRLYVTEQKTGPEIAKIAGVRSSTSVYNWLAKYGIPRRQARDSQRPVEPTRQMLQDLYCDQEMSIDVIAHQLGSSESSISRLLDQYGIEKRARWSKMAGWNEGQPLSQEQRDRLSEIAKHRTGKKSPRSGARLSKSTRAQISDSLKGRFRGAENPQWKGGRKYARNQWMDRYEYKEWRAAVFERDSYTCQMCGKPSTGNIQAHHIRPWRDFPALRFDVSNGITLCKKCHHKTKGKELDCAARFDSILQASQ